MTSLDHVSTPSVTPELRAAFEAAMAELRGPEPPRFRYFQKGDGPMFSWTTERFEDRFASFVHVPSGDGWWTMDEDSISAHKLRRDAKARALKLFRAWQAGEKEPWK